MNFKQTIFKNKRVLVWGLGLHGGGIGAVRFLIRAGASVTVTDLRTKKQLAPAFRALSTLPRMTYVLGKHRDQDFLSADLIIKNPGIPSRTPFTTLIKKHRIPLTSDMGIFFRFCPGTIIGITGTRGKSTTSALIHHFLTMGMGRKGRRVFLAGNIRVSALDVLPRMKKNDIAVLELSSFQLEDLRHDAWNTGNPWQKSPSIAVLTNILRDHLNRHASVAAYAQAKAMIIADQKPDDYVFVNPDDPRAMSLARAFSSRVFTPRLPHAWEGMVDETLGRHYRSSVALALGVARLFGIPTNILTRAFHSFRTLPGRQQELGPVRGIHVVNDTTSTVPEATIAAIERFRERAGNVHLLLIAGGQDKNLIFDDMARVIIRHVDTLILLPGTATKKLQKHIAYRISHIARSKKLQTANCKPQNCFEVASMHEAVITAFRDAQKGDWIVLSPGAASFGLFLNEFDRGDQFEREVKILRQKNHP